VTLGEKHQTNDVNGKLEKLANDTAAFHISFLLKEKLVT